MDKTLRVKWACYSSNVSMAVVGNLSPLLFVTFRGTYGISYSLLGLLVLINFVTQLTVDLVFSFFSHKFNIPKVVKFTPVLTVVGLVIYAFAPNLVPSFPYLGLVIGTVLFSASSGFNEVLISPVIAALPSENPEREMSKLHSVYAWGVVGVVIFATLFLLVFQRESWQMLALILTIIPMVALYLFFGAEIPKMETPEKISGVFALMKRKELWLCVFAIFLGGASECTMAQWSSGYLEQALSIPKVWGDIFGVALFALALGLGRTLYANYGKNVEKVLFLGGLGAAVCYFLAAISPLPIIGLIACVCTGFCVSMLWPGSLLAASDRLPSGGVFLFAMMAAGGDLGASVGPQLVGVVADLAASNTGLLSLAETLGLTAEQFGIKAGLMIGFIFPLLSVLIYGALWKNKKKRSFIIE